MLKLKLMLLFCFIGIQVKICAQSVQQILDNHFEKTGINKSHSTYMNGIDDIRFRYPFIEEINLRTESDQNNLARQEYALRFMFNNFGLGKTFKKEANILKQKISIELDKIEQELLFDLYNDLIKLNFYKLEDSLNIKRIEQDETSINYLISLIQSGTSVNAKDILRLESDIFENKNNAAIIRKNADDILKKWNLTSFVFPVKMGENEIYSIVHNIDVASLQPMSNLGNFLDQELDNIDYYLNKKEDRTVLDFLQLRYSKRDNLLFQDEFSIGLGLRLPYKGSHAKTKARYKSSLLENSFKNNIDKVNFELEIKEKIEEFDEIYNELNYIKKQQLDRFNILNTGHIDNINALESFKNDLKLAYAEKTLELTRKLWLSYIEILYKSERLDGQNVLK